MQLTSAQRADLRRQAHDLSPLVHIGKNGVTEHIVNNIDQALTVHELIKVKFQDFQDQKRELSDQIAEQLTAGLVGLIGNMAILYRRQPDPDRRRIPLLGVD